MKFKKKDGSSNFSRREFVKAAGLGAAAVSVQGSSKSDKAVAATLPPSQQEKTEKTVNRGEGEIPYKHNDLYEQGPQPSYTGCCPDEIAFPLGGIGTGSISLGGWGQLRDWEIMNRPAKGFVSPESFFMLKTRFADRPPVTKVLQGPVQGSYAGGGHSVIPDYPRNDMGHGLPHFRTATFTGTYPMAEVLLEDPDIPLRATLKAFNPLIPLNSKDSGIPVAILSYTFTNTSDNEISATLFGNLTNIIGDQKKDKRINEIKQSKGVTGLYLKTDQPDFKSRLDGSLVLATTWPEATVWPRWIKEFGLLEFWKATALSDEFPPDESGDGNTGTIAADFTVKPREETTVTFLLGWHFPIFEHYWKTTTESSQGGYQIKREEGEEPFTWKNYYSTLWTDAWDVVSYTASNFDRLRSETELFCETLFSSTLPIHVLDAVSSQISTLKTATCIRLEDGTFYGFEGSSDKAGCCVGSCSHVWYYAQALPYLFPDLQRSMTDAHFANSFLEDGLMSFRMPLPLGAKFEPTFHPAGDGQMGLILQVYRDWLLSGNDDWLRSIWPRVRQALEFAWKYWDSDKDGVMEGVKHNTYNVQFYGPETLTGSLYIASLRAAAEMASFLGEQEKAQEYRSMAEKGSAWTDDNLFNGEYYEQQVRPDAYKVWPEPFHKLHDHFDGDSKFKEWPKWQFGKGCLSDQVIGQWYAQMLDLGDVYKKDHIRKALESVFRYNWLPDLWDHAGVLRVYALNDEAGLLICTWPKGERPGHAVFFADEVWCGIEYQVASHLIYEGLIDQGLAIVKGVRERHRGDRRNPWDEFECGHHYVRSMASYAVLLALSGFRYSAPNKRISFTPRIYTENFRTFFSTASGWGLYSQTVDESEARLALDIKYGSLSLEELDVPLPRFEIQDLSVTLEGKVMESRLLESHDRLRIAFNPSCVGAGGTLKVLVRKARA